MKKKLTALITLAIMTMSLAGCGDNASTTEYEMPDFDSLTMSPEQMEAYQQQMDDLMASLEDTEENVDDVASETDSHSLRGSVEDGVFTNEYFKISFDCEGMTQLSDEDIAYMLGLSAELLDENGMLPIDNYEEYTAGTIYDCMFYLDDGISSILANYIDMDYNAPGASSYYTEDLYADAIISQYESMTNPSFTFKETTKETLGGLEYTCVSADTDAGLSQISLFRKQDNYMIMIVFTYNSSTPELANDFFDSFIAVE